MSPVGLENQTRSLLSWPVTKMSSRPSWLKSATMEAPRLRVLDERDAGLRLRQQALRRQQRRADDLPGRFHGRTSHVLFAHGVWNA
jgi:hypothetical protein